MAHYAFFFLGPQDGHVIEVPSEQLEENNDEIFWIPDQRNASLIADKEKAGMPIGYDEMAELANLPYEITHTEVDDEGDTLIRLMFRADLVAPV